MALLRPIEKKCSNCTYYEIKIPGGAFCNHHKQHFPNPAGWIKEDGSLPVGLRTCKLWKRKIVNNG